MVEVQPAGRRLTADCFHRFDKGAALCYTGLGVPEREVRPPRHGGMAERTMATVLKTVVASGSPGVRIPLPPPVVADFGLPGFNCRSSNRKSEIHNRKSHWGRCRSGRSGPPAKWLWGVELHPGFESLPPRLRALVAQRIRASPCGGEGRAFESRRGCLIIKLPPYWWEFAIH
jgi:hypothetical protein